MNDVRTSLPGVFHNGLCSIAIVVATVLASAVYAQVVQQPQPGSPLRAELLDVARPAFVAETGGPIEFVVRRLAVSGEWAFGDVALQRPGGQPIDWTRTKFAHALQQAMFNTENSFFLLRNRNGGWSIAEIVVGPTDVTWDWWRQQYGIPEALFLP